MELSEIQKWIVVQGFAAGAGSLAWRSPGYGLVRCLRRLPPEVLEPGRRQLGIAHRVLDVAMAEVGLQGAGVVASIGKRKAAGVAQHVRMCLEIDAGSTPDALDHLGEAGGRERRTTLAHEHER
jgi:hypothetical protein